MGFGGQRTALAGLEVHHVIAQRAAAQTPRRIQRFLQHSQRNAKTPIGGLGTGNGLKHQVQRRGRFLFENPQLRGDMGQHAALHGNLIGLPQLVEQAEQGTRDSGAVAGRIDADHRIAAGLEQTIQHRCQDAAWIVGGMIGLQTGGKPSRQADRGAKPGQHPAFARHRDQILIAHQFRHCGDHFRGQAGRQRRQGCCIRQRTQQPVTQFTHTQARYWRKGRGIVAVHNQPGHLVILVGHQRLFEKMAQRNLGQR